MKGLVLKDWYSVVNNGRGLLLMMAILSFPLTQQGGLLGFILTGTVICSMMSATSFSIDHQTNWNRFAFTLPVSKRVIVQSKFVSLILFTLLGIGLSFLFGLVMMFITGKGAVISEVSILEYFGFTIFAFAASLLLGTNMIVLSLKYGAEQARMYLVASYLVPAGLIWLLISQVPSISTWVNTLDIMGAMSISLIISIIWSIAGCYVSLNIIEKKEY